MGSDIRNVHLYWFKDSKFYERGHIFLLAKPLEDIYSKQWYVYIIGIQCHDLHSEKLAYKKKLQKRVFWNSLQILHREPLFYHTMHLFLGFILLPTAQLNALLNSSLFCRGPITLSKKVSSIKKVLHLHCTDYSYKFK